MGLSGNILLPASHIFSICCQGMLHASLLCFAASSKADWRNVFLRHITSIARAGQVDLTISLSDVHINSTVLAECCQCCVCRRSLQKAYPRADSAVCLCVCVTDPDPVSSSLAWRRHMMIACLSAEDLRSQGCEIIYLLTVFCCVLRSPCLC